jgi:hypothetical protein
VSARDGGGAADEFGCAYPVGVVMRGRVLRVSVTGHEHDFDAVLDAILAGVEDAQCEVQEDKEGRGRMGVGLLCIGVGAMGMEEMGRTVDFLLRRRDAFVGFDMAGAEQDVEAFQPFFQRVTDAGIRATCHASEDLVDGVPVNQCRPRVWSALLPACLPVRLSVCVCRWAG